MEKIKGLKNKVFKTRELTNSEKTLITLLFAVILIWFAYRFVYTPQMEKLASLAEDKINYQDKILEINETLRKERQINEDWDNLHIEKEKILSQYFPKLDQAQIIYLLNSLVEDENLYVNDLNFNRPEYEDINDFQVRNMSISIPYNGNYEGIIDVINRIKESPRKILVNNMSMDVGSDGVLQGNMALKVYSLEGIAEGDEKVIYIDVAEGKKQSPFGFIKTDTPEEDNVEIEKPEIKPYVEDTLLDFENKNSFFIPSHSNIKGDVSLSSKAKSKKHSLKIEYDILAVEEENKLLVDVSRNNVDLKYPPNTLGIWLYSYNYSPASFGIGFKGQMGEEIFVPFTEGIGWTGWKYLEIAPPYDMTIYPLEIEKLYIEIPDDRDDIGVILLDKLEAVYTRNMDEDGNDTSLPLEYAFHTVEFKDTIESISIKYYGNSKYVDEILKLNEMKSTDILRVGKVLVLRKR